ncbi:hypothetical protein ACIA8G_17205 [Lentzea sp. NPDC051213]|uniref:DUF6414 family protein n=1 Tax=Lentzea sp. NPDC051213 TaxID=3364126 RepID=UPI00378902B3
MDTFFLVIMAVGFVIAAYGLGVYVTEEAAKRKKAHESATQAVENKTPATLAGHGSEQQAEFDRTLIRTFLFLDENSIMSLYSQTAHAAGEATKIEVEKGRQNEGTLGVKASVFEAAGKRGSSETVRETFEARTNAERALDLVMKQLAASNSLDQLDLTVQQPKHKRSILTSSLVDLFSGTSSDSRLRSMQGYVKIKAEYRVASTDDNNIALYASSDGLAEISLSFKHVQLTRYGQTLFADGRSVTAICFGLAARWEEDRSTLVVLPTALYFA